jgi:oligopeptide transport system substrate-binding protein
MFRLFLIPVVLGALVGAAVVWSGDSSSSEPADFTFINRGDNKSLDPNTMSWMQDIRLAYALWEGLYSLDPVTMKPILGTADKVDVDEATHTVWTFHIRENAKWSNGDPVKAGDFIFAWRRFLETPGEYSYLHFYIKGAQAYSDSYAAYVKAIENGAIPFDPASANSTSASAAGAKMAVATTRPSLEFSTVGEVALDDHTLRVTLTNPLPFFPALCAFTPFFPMNERSMRPFLVTDPASGLQHYDARFTRAENLVTNGPYHMAEWSFKRRIRMIASDTYWDRANVKSRIIDQVYSDDALSAYRAYDRGDVDWLSDVDPDLAHGLLEQQKLAGASGPNQPSQPPPRTDLHVFPAYGTYYYSYNCLPTLPGGRPNPLTDVRVRRALSMAIDKTPIVRDVGRLGQPIATTYVPPNVFEGYPPTHGLPYDVAAARQLLADAGYPDGRGFPVLSILYNTEGTHADIAQIIRRQWLDNLGITTNLEGVEVKVFGQRLHSQDYDIARSNWYGDYDDPSTFTDKYLSTSDDNDSKWANKTYDDYCAAAKKEPDALKRMVLLSKAEQVLLDDAPIVPLFTPVNAFMFRSNVKGIPLAPNAMLMFKSVQVVH